MKVRNKHLIANSSRIRFHFQVSLDMELTDSLEKKLGYLQVVAACSAGGDIPSAARLVAFPQ
jgi:hypothetical protein